jgi:hypothetical protein
MFRRKTTETQTPSTEQQLAASRAFFDELADQIGPQATNPRVRQRHTTIFTPLLLGASAEGYRVDTTPSGDDTKPDLLVVARDLKLATVLGIHVERISGQHVSINRSGSIRVITTSSQEAKQHWSPTAAASQLVEHRSGVAMSHMIGRWHDLPDGHALVIAPFAYYSPEAQQILRNQFTTAIDQSILNTGPSAERAS